MAVTMMGLTLRQLADAKGFMVEELIAFGVRDGLKDKHPCVDIPYRDANGDVVETKKRLRLDEPDRFWWPRATKTMPYGLERLASLPSDTPVILVEGESDCWTLWTNGFAALGIPGASTWKPQHAVHLTGRQVLVWQEPGDAGEKLVAGVTRDIQDARVIRGAAAKDATALRVADRDAFAAAMHALIDGARSSREEADAERRAEADATLAASRDVLEDPEILEQVERYIVECGYAGDTHPPMLVYLSLTSRCLRRPLNLGIVAASASGKSAAIDAALPLFPESAYVLVQASSPRALVYSDDDFEHKIVVVAEIDSIPTEEGPAASAIRSIATDNRMTYDVTERDAQTGRWGVRHIVKPGPTGLITTSTKLLREQLSTRMLTIGISDSSLQTRRVLHAHAAAVSGQTTAPSAERLLAAQRWLELAGARAVHIPFAHVLADAVPVDHVRMRRDFRQLLTVIEAVAFLRQRQRARNEQGSVIATLDDYRAARELVLDVFTATASGGITREVRSVVRIVRELAPTAPDGVTVATVASRLVPPVHAKTALRRIQAAIRLGLLVNSEARRSHPLKLTPGEPLPEERDALPTAEELQLMCVDHPEPAAPLHRPPEEPITAASRSGAPPGHDLPADAPIDSDGGAVTQGGADSGAPLKGRSLLHDSAIGASVQLFPGGMGANNLSANSASRTLAARKATRFVVEVCWWDAARQEHVWDQYSDLPDAPTASMLAAGLRGLGHEVRWRRVVRATITKTATTTTNDATNDATTKPMPDVSAE